ncbi:phosphomannose isomerase type II C-terminal cupin domain [Marivirga salinae]|uniref:Phosphomannose isomerase type II C-terminal cupin domain n=1 Tax=Marivirga salinarum TaxID=3059078 RepID=A0AA51N8W9_9BACT|nr:phosphomannose isomerase type II C-terminal cupin domain [Marivirga sp. BDSF4-3]WMN11001.1 phosphomannose isomerase type II C-terminal cupin domain [Marivirga sp. BDSF4-3]
MLVELEKNKLDKYTEKRPWGNFEQFTHNEKCTVKLINVDAHAELSLQYHLKRSEFWKVIEGSPIILIGNQKVTANKGDEFYIPQLTHHQIITESKPACILEIAFGDFDENDIVRIKDKYNRVKNE